MDVPTILSTPIILSLPIEVQERLVERVETVLDGLESRESYVRTANITLNQANEPLITATLGGFGDRIEVVVLGRQQDSGQPTLEWAFHRIYNGEPMVNTDRIPHQIFEERLHAFLL
jgi:hypothetical protein